jgi:putative ABC transport system ATP-binding protein
VVTVPLIAYQDVSVVRDGRSILDGVTAEVSASGITVVVGPSGSGKSTLLRLANRLAVPDRGAVIVRGEDTATQDPLRLRRRVGMVFQRPTLFPGTVLDNLRAADPGIERTAAEALLARVGLGASVVDRSDGLSGGEAQRVCIARALAAEPTALLMDEPTSSLDPAARDGLETLARTLAEGGLPIVWVSHDLQQMRRLADSVLIVVDGRVAFASALGQLDQASGAAMAFLSGADVHAG